MAEHNDVQQLVQQLYDHKTRAAARQQLRQKGDEAVAPLMELVQNKSTPENVRWCAITLLAARKHEDAIPELIKIIKTNLGLKGEAARALQTITGKDLGEDPAAWEQAVYGTTDEKTAKEEKPAVADERTALFQEAVGDVTEEFSWEDDGYLYLRLPLGNNRKHQLVVTFNETDSDGRPLTTFYTECGPAIPEALESISRRNVTLQFGKFMVETDEEGKQKIVMRELRPSSILSPELVRDIVLSMAREADNLEFELTQSDHI